MPIEMKAAYLPGDSTVEIRTVSIPEPGHGEVLLRVMAALISDAFITNTWERARKVIRA